MSDMDDILAGNEPAEPETVSEPEAAEAPQQAEPEAEAPAEPEVPKEPDTVPLATFLDLKAEMKAIKQQVQSAQPKPEPRPAPDVFEDPQGFTQHIQSTVSQAVQNERLNMSEAIARQSHGDEAVDAAFEALKAANDPGAYQTVMAAKMPYDALVKWHARQKIAQEIGDDPTAWQAKQREQIKQEILAELATKQVKDAAAQPAPSMANVTGNGGAQNPGWAGPADLDDLL